MIPVRKLAPVTVAYAAITVWLGALGLITTPYLLDKLGPSTYAVFALIAIMTAYLSNLELGFGHATVRFLSRARAQGDVAFEGRIIGTSLLVFASCALVAGVIAIVGAPFAVKRFADFPVSVEDDAVVAVRLGAVVIACALLSNCFSAALQAHGRFRALVWSRLVFGTLSSIGAVTTAFLFEDVRAVLLSQMAVALGLCAVLLLSLRHAAHAPVRPAFHRATFRRMAGFGVLILATGVVYQVMIQGPPTVLAGKAVSSQLAAYAVPALVLQQLTQLVSSASLGFLPFASGESASEDRSRLADVFASHLRLSLLVMGPIAGFLAVFADPLLAAWVGSNFGSDAADPLRLLAGAALLLALSAPPADVARALGKPSWTLGFTIAAASIGLLVAFAAVGPWEATGAALALFAGLAAATPPFILLVQSLLLQRPASRLLAACAAPTAAVLGITATFAAGSVVLGGLLGALCVGASATVLYVVAVHRLVLSEVERRTLKSGTAGFVASVRAARRRARPSSALDPT
jgi:O-antigen/teichoic acid export membrane protein